jgi:hypothetical protein
MQAAQRNVAILYRVYTIGEVLEAYDLASLVHRAEDGMEEFEPGLYAYFREAFADIEGEPDRCPLEMVLRWEEGNICCPHGPARIMVSRDLCPKCRRAVEEAGAEPVVVEVVEFDPAGPPPGRYSGYCHERVAFVVRG